MIKRILASVIIATVGAEAAANTDDIEKFQRSATVKWGVNPTGEILSFGVGFVPCGVAVPEKADVLYAQAIASPSALEPVEGSFELDYSAGDLCLKAVSLSSEGHPSLPSPNALLVFVIPSPPEQTLPAAGGGS